MTPPGGCAPPVSVENYKNEILENLEKLNLREKYPNLISKKIKIGALSYSMGVPAVFAAVGELLRKRENYYDFVAHVAVNGALGGTVKRI